MNTILNEEKRREADTKLHKQAKPISFFDFYVVYQTKVATEFPHAFSYPNLIGYKTREEADSLVGQISSKCDWCEVVTEFPYEVLSYWKEKEDKK